MPAVELPGLWTSAFLGTLGLVIAWVLVRSLAPQPRALDAPPPSPANALSGPAQTATTAPHSATLSEEAMRETARELAARLDGKIRLLESLLRDADRAATRLEAAIAAAARPELRSAHGTSLLAPAEPIEPSVPKCNAAPRCVPGQAEGLKEAATAKTTPVRAEPPPPAGYGASPGSSRFEPVYALADHGCSVEEIAHRTGIPLGEVQLALNLRRVRLPAGML